MRIAIILLLVPFAESSIATEPVCGHSPESLELASLVIGHPSQKRSTLQCNTLLADIAAERAELLLNGKVGENDSPNRVLVQHGYRFPTFYPPTGNQVEAVAKNKTSAETALQYLTESNKHRDHVLGRGEFFSRQNELGVGYAENASGESQFVVLIAEPYATPDIVYKYDNSYKAPHTTINANCPKNWRHSSDAKLRKTCREIETRKRQEREDQEQ